ncbi:MAG: helix-turn-helix domain-containing protein [Terriglobales bacterium]
MKTRSKIKLNEYQALAEIRFLIRNYLRFSENGARAAGLEPQQHQLLLAIKGLPEDSVATVGELARRLQIQHHSTVELVDRLVKRGLVRRQQAGVDRRMVMLGLTAKGEKILNKLSLDHSDELRILAPELVGAIRRLIPAAGRSRAQRTTKS